MAKCAFCGRSTGVFEGEHAGCRAKHERAISMIPGFFTKMMDSPTPPETFVELLQRAADASFIARSQLRDLSKASLNAIIDSILAERTATVAEARRLVDIADALEKDLPEGIDLNETVTKILMLAELSTGLLPDYVSFGGQIPITFGPGEAGLWIFNQVDTWWSEPRDEAGAIRFDPGDGASGIYVGRNPADLPPVPGQDAKPRRGDLLITNRKLYFIRNEIKHVAIAVPQIMSLTPYADGISLVHNPRKPRATLFRLDDPWFAANLIAGLVLRVPRVVA